jgi:YidB-like protein
MVLAGSRLAGRKPIERGSARGAAFHGARPACRGMTLSQLARLLPEVIDKLTPDGKLPKETGLLPEPDEPNDSETAKR